VTTDLSGLERAAERAGLPGLRARLMPPDRRRGAWFRFAERELLVSERVIERLSPAEGEALLAHAIVERRRLAFVNKRLLLSAALLALAFGALAWLLPGLRGLWVLGFVVLSLGSLGARTRAREIADDETIDLLGEPETLIRALNRVHQDELHLGGAKLKARPDVHRRCERLVSKHQLRLPPELRAGATPPLDG